MTIYEFHTGMRKHFDLKGESASKFLDRTFLRMKKASLDLFAFDDWLHEKFGEYEDEGKSMSDIIEEKFSKEARVFCKSAIG